MRVTIRQPQEPVFVGLPDCWPAVDLLAMGFVTELLNLGFAWPST